MPSTLTALAALFALSGAPWAFQLQDEPLDPAEIESAVDTPPADEARPLDPAEIDAAADPEVTAVAEPDDIVRLQPDDRRPLTVDERADILDQAAAALASAKTARGRFTQVAPDFAVTTGDFAIRRPGRMRFAYDDPTPLLIISDGATVAIEDRDLETVDRVPLASTPLGLVLDDTLDFAEEADVTGVRRADGLVSVSMRDRSGEAEGELTLIFDAATFELVSWRTEDDAGGVTSVQLSDVETNISLNPRQFRIEDPEDEDDRRR